MVNTTLIYTIFIIILGIVLFYLEISVYHIGFKGYFIASLFLGGGLIMLYFIIKKKIVL